VVEHIFIEEIVGRSTQGITLPFICRGVDDHQYFVKGIGAGRRSQLCELICGQLAQLFGLETADFAVVDIPEELIIPAVRSDLTELGAGLAFGSKALPHVQELSFSQKIAIQDRLAKDIFMFDLWINNADRHLTARGGNPNLLWDCEREEVVVIDHNQAFERGFDTASFFETHIFAAQGHQVFADIVECADYCQRFETALAGFDQACDNVPPAWWLHDHGVPADFDVDEAREVLARFRQDNFWRMP
jgi:hypothetical protein